MQLFVSRKKPSVNSNEQSVGKKMRIEKIHLFV